MILAYQVPINFEKGTNNTFPFKVFARIIKKNDIPSPGEDKLYINVEKLSIVYSYFDEKLIDIEDIDKIFNTEIEIGKRKYVCLRLDYTQKNLIITNAKIFITDDPEEGSAGPGNDASNYFPNFENLILAIIYIDSITNNNYDISIQQFIYHPITKYACQDAGTLS